MIIIVTLLIYYIRYIEDKETYDFAFIHRAKCNIIIPESIDNLIYVLDKNIKLENPRKICVKGAGYSHGGHTMFDNAIQIDMKNINNITIINDSVIRVGAGTTWKEIIEELDLYDRSIIEMQSYWNFSVGGSISVNCHGRGMKYGTIADTIYSMDVLIYSKSIYRIKTLYPNNELFNAIVGGYGAIGIILSVVILTDKNIPIMKFVDVSTIDKYSDDLNTIFKYNPVMYNAEIYPESYNKVHHIYWLQDSEPLNKTRLRSSENDDMIKYLINITAIQCIKSINVMKNIRAHNEQINNAKLLSVWRNYEMSHDVKTLQPLTKRLTTYVLQEYFIPVRYISQFMTKLINIFDQHNVNILNILTLC